MREGEEEDEYIQGISGPDESSDEIKWKELAQLEIVGEAGRCAVASKIES